MELNTSAETNENFYSRISNIGKSMWESVKTYSSEIAIGATLLAALAIGGCKDENQPTKEDRAKDVKAYQTLTEKVTGTMEI